MSNQLQMDQYLPNSTSNLVKIQKSQNHLQTHLDIFNPLLLI